MDVRFKLELCKGGSCQQLLTRHWTLSANGSKCLTIYADTLNEAVNRAMQYIRS